MNSKTPQSYIMRAHRQLRMARINLVAALELLATQGYPPTHSEGVAEALNDNTASTQYLQDLAHKLELTAPPVKP